MASQPAAPESEVRSAPTKVWVGWLLRVLVIVLVVGISVAVFLFRDRFAELAAVGYSGIFLVSLLGNATLVLPAPFLILVFAAGSALPPVLVGLVAGTGAALGELTGYAAGFGGRAAVEKQAVYERLSVWMQRRGAITVFVLAAIPNPFLDLAGIAAGSLRYPLWRFLLFCWLGKLLKTTAVAWAGAQSLTIIEPFLH